MKIWWSGNYYAKYDFPKSEILIHTISHYCIEDFSLHTYTYIYIYKLSVHMNMCICEYISHETGMANMSVKKVFLWKRCSKIEDMWYKIRRDFWRWKDGVRLGNKVWEEV